MGASITVPASSLLAFLLVLARMTGIFVFIPLPFKDAGPSVARIVAALGCTVALYSRWPVLNMNGLTLSSATQLLVSDAALGTAIGLMVSFISEGFSFGAQTLAVQAGYGYASVVDPTTQADSDVLAVFAQLLAGLLFFAFGIHRFLIQIFAASLDSYPPGAFALTQGLAKEVIRLSAGILSVGLRLALPVIGLLLLVEISLALLGRMSSQLHLGTNAAPVKLLLTLGALAALLAVTPSLYSAYSGEILGGIRRSILH